ncbi:unnamed protein product [Amoebophrya sp. A120]|nr:unnamed protein product [Amoebophrya sp. A120]|eukprot:GSA120T00016699001.1
MPMPNMNALRTRLFALIYLATTPQALSSASTTAAPLGSAAAAPSIEDVHKKLSKLFTFDKVEHGDFLSSMHDYEQFFANGTLNYYKNLTTTSAGNISEWSEKVQGQIPQWMQKRAVEIHGTMVGSPMQLDAKSSELQYAYENDMIAHERVARAIVKEFAKDIRDEAAVKVPVVTTGVWSSRVSHTNKNGRGSRPQVARLNADTDPIGVLLLELFGVDLNQLTLASLLQMMAFLEHFIRSPLATFDLENLVAEDHGRLIQSLNSKLERHLQTVADSKSSLLRTSFNDTERATLQTDVKRVNKKANNDALSNKFEKFVDTHKAEARSASKKGRRTSTPTEQDNINSDPSPDMNSDGASSSPNSDQNSEATKELLEEVKSIANTLSSDEVKKLQESEQALNTHEVHLHSRHTQRVWIENSTNVTSSLNALNALNLSEVEKSSVLEGLHVAGTEQQQQGGMVDTDAVSSTTVAPSSSANKQTQTTSTSTGEQIADPNDPEALVQIEIEESEDIDLLFLTNQSTAAKAEFNLHTMLGQAAQIMSIPLAKYLLTPEASKQYLANAEAQRDPKSRRGGKNYKRRQMWEWAHERLHLPEHSKLLDRLPFNWTDFNINSTLFMQIRIDNTSDTSIAENLDRETLVHTILDVYRSISVVDIASTFPATLALAAFVDSVISAIEARATRVNMDRVKFPNEPHRIEDGVFFKGFQHVLEANKIGLFTREVQRMENLEDAVRKEQMQKIYLNFNEIFPSEVKLGFAGMIGTVKHLEYLDAEAKKEKAAQDKKKRGNCVAEVDERANVLLRGKLSLYRMDHIKPYPGMERQESEVIQANGQKVMTKSSRFLNMWDAITAPYAQEDFYSYGLRGRFDYSNLFLNDAEIAEVANEDDEVVAYFRELVNSDYYKLNLLQPQDLERLHALPEIRPNPDLPVLKYGHHGAYLNGGGAGRPTSSSSSSGRTTQLQGRYGSNSAGLFNTLFFSKGNPRTAGQAASCFEYSRDLCTPIELFEEPKNVVNNQLADVASGTTTTNVVEDDLAYYDGAAQHPGAGESQKLMAGSAHQMNTGTTSTSSPAGMLAHFSFVFHSSSFLYSLVGNMRALVMIGGLAASFVLLLGAFGMMDLSGKSNFAVEKEESVSRTKLQAADLGTVVELSQDATGENGKVV